MLGLLPDADKCTCRSLPVLVTIEAQARRNAKTLLIFVNQLVDRQG